MSAAYSFGVPSGFWALWKLKCTFVLPCLKSCSCTCTERHAKKILGWNPCTVRVCKIACTLGRRARSRLCNFFSWGHFELSPDHGPAADAGGRGTPDELLPGDS